MIGKAWYFCILSVVYVVISLMTPPPKAEQVEGLTWDSPLTFLRRSEIRGMQDPRLLAGLLFGFLALMYWLIR